MQQDMPAALQASLADTTNGRIRGAVNNGVHVFKGVRYAATTAGANRFLPPQPVAQWAGVQDALTFGASAPQFAVQENTDPFYSWYGALQPISEDCLFLNVFTPGLGDARRPILFWIHGGGWREFSGTAPGFDGTNLARAQDVVVVTINHRLNGFGYLRMDRSDERFADSGNAGLLDVVAALTWVRDNAAAFGGDPDNVTLFGESGGASKIAAILGMKAAHGLFHKAIVQSSAGGLRLADPEEAARTAANLAKALGLPRADGAALQDVPMDVLVAATKSAGGPFRGMIDGRSFDADPFHDKAPAISVNVPVMAGCTNTETTYHLRFQLENFSLEYPDVRRRLARFLQIDAARTESIIDAYRVTYPAYGPSDILAMVTSDYVFKRNTSRIAALQAASAGAPVYAYLFAWETPIEGGRMRAPHTSEVPFVFGTTAAAVGQLGSGPDLQPLTERMMAVWAAFARHGDPNNPLVPHWKPFSDSDRQTMVLDLESRLENDPGGQARATLDALPFYGYGNPMDAFCKD
jgi:para-nitrobenzyl esterase